MDAKDRVIVALDFPSGREALDLVERLEGRAGFFKVGLQLFIAEGPAFVEKILKRGDRVFLDLKLHDIPHTVASAALEAAELGIDLLTLHASGGTEMLSRSAQALADWRRRTGKSGPRLLGVTLLTSLNAQALKDLGMERSLEDTVLTLAVMARQAGLEGIVCSPREIRRLRAAGLNRMTLVTPGIRPAGCAADDQERTLTPAQAVREGADLLVIGRPISQAADPLSALQSILGEIEEGQGGVA